MQSSSTDSRSQVIPQLRALLDGRAIVPGDPTYDRACTVFYGGFDKRPAVIARVHDAAEVGRVVRLAREAGLDLSIRAGGHSTAGHGLCDGGIMIDVSEMRAIELDVPGRTAWAQAGATTGEYTKAAGAHGLATGFGDTGSVGIGGLTLGGGVGFLVRKHGLTIDDLLAAEIVTADGQTLQVSDASHPDLFWAIRGGGGNFGVVTRFQFRLQSLPSVVGGMLLLPAEPEVIHRFAAEAEAAPDELSTIANIMAAPPMPFIPAHLHGKLVVMALLAYAGDTEAGQRAIAPFRALATPLADMVRPMSYPEMFPPEPPEFHPLAVGRNLYVDAVTQPMAETILQFVRSSNAMMAVSQVRVLGGASARVPADATAYAHRGKRIMMNVAAIYMQPGDAPQHADWVSRFVTALAPTDTSAYVNFIGPEGPDRVRDAYPAATWNRLRTVKRQYDPTNLFHINHNIPPAGA